jgi:hypothetical protein
VSSAVQVKMEKAQQNIKGLLNVFGAYDHTTDKMYLQCYKKKTAKQFVDFLKRVDRRYYDKVIQNIFVVIDNLSGHKSKKVKEDIFRYCPRIKLVFLLVRSPELNLIEVNGHGYKEGLLTILHSKMSKK